MSPGEDRRLPHLRSVAERMAHARELAGHTRSSLERELRARGVASPSVMTIRRTEAGLRSPTVEEVAALADVAGLPASWILEGRPPSVDATSERERSEREDAWILGTIRAEALRAETGGPAPLGAAVHDRVAAVHERVAAAHATGRLSDEAWSRWLSIRDAALLLAAAPGAVREH